MGNTTCHLLDLSVFEWRNSDSHKDRYSWEWFGVLLLWALVSTQWWLWWLWWCFSHSYWELAQNPRYFYSSYTLEFDINIDKRWVGISPFVLLIDNLSSDQWTPWFFALLRWLRDPFHKPWLKDPNEIHPNYSDLIPPGPPNGTWYWYEGNPDIRPLCQGFNQVGENPLICLPGMSLVACCCSLSLWPRGTTPQIHRSTRNIRSQTVTKNWQFGQTGVFL